MCGESRWKAAQNTARQKKNLDETGLEIVGCRHGLAQWAVNMFQGEIYGYANYIQAKKMLPAGVRFFWEDIVWRYWKWASKIGREETKTMRPALSVMHAKAHKWSCQVYLFDSVDNNYSDFDSGVGVEKRGVLLYLFTFTAYSIPLSLSSTHIKLFLYPSQFS